MLYRRNLAAVLGATFLLFCLTACSQSAADASEEDSPVTAVSGTGSEAEGGLYFPTNMKNEIIWADAASYNIIDNVEGLYEQSENVVVAFVTGYEAYLDGNMPFVLSKATVSETLKGDLKIGDEIAIEELGQHLKGGGDRSVDGIPLLFPGMKVILFLGSEASLGDTDKTGYGLTGSYLGKFIYHPDGTIYNFSLIGGDPELTLSDVTGPLTEEEFRALLPQGSTTAGTSEVTGTETTAAETAAAE